MPRQDNLKDFKCPFCPTTRQGRGWRSVFMDHVHTAACIVGREIEPRDVYAVFGGHDVKHKPLFCQAVREDFIEAENNGEWKPAGGGVQGVEERAWPPATGVLRLGGNAAPHQQISIEASARRLCGRPDNSYLETSHMIWMIAEVKKVLNDPNAPRAPNAPQKKLLPTAELSLQLSERVRRRRGKVIHALDKFLVADRTWDHRHDWGLRVFHLLLMILVSVLLGVALGRAFGGDEEQAQPFWTSVSTQTGYGSGNYTRCSDHSDATQRSDVDFTAHRQGAASSTPHGRNAIALQDHDNDSTMRPQGDVLEYMVTEGVDGGGAVNSTNANLDHGGGNGTGRGTSLTADYSKNGASIPSADNSSLRGYSDDPENSELRATLLERVVAARVATGTLSARALLHHRGRYNNEHALPPLVAVLCCSDGHNGVPLGVCGNCKTKSYLPVIQLPTTTHKTQSRLPGNQLPTTYHYYYSKPPASRVQGPRRMKTKTNSNSEAESVCKFEPDPTLESAQNKQQSRESVDAGVDAPTKQDTHVLENEAECRPYLTSQRSTLGFFSLFVFYIWVACYRSRGPEKDSVHVRRNHENLLVTTQIDADTEERSAIVTVDVSAQIYQFRDSWLLDKLGFRHVALGFRFRDQGGGDHKREVHFVSGGKHCGRISVKREFGEFEKQNYKFAEDETAELGTCSMGRIRVVADVVETLEMYACLTPDELDAIWEKRRTTNELDWNDQTWRTPLPPPYSLAPGEHGHNCGTFAVMLLTYLRLHLAASELRRQMAAQLLAADVCLSVPLHFLGDVFPFSCLHRTGSKNVFPPHRDGFPVFGKARLWSFMWFVVLPLLLYFRAYECILYVLEYAAHTLEHVLNWSGLGVDISFFTYSFCLQFISSRVLAFVDNIAALHCTSVDLSFLFYVFYAVCFSWCSGGITWRQYLHPALVRCGCASRWGPAVRHGFLSLPKPERKNGASDGKEDRTRKGENSDESTEDADEIYDDCFDPYGDGRVCRYEYSSLETAEEELKQQRENLQALSSCTVVLRNNELRHMCTRNSGYFARLTETVVNLFGAQSAGEHRGRGGGEHDQGETHTIAVGTVSASASSFGSGSTSASPQDAEGVGTNPVVLAEGVACPEESASGARGAVVVEEDGGLDMDA